MQLTAKDGFKFFPVRLSLPFQEDFPAKFREKK